MADNVERVKIIRDQSFLFENKWSGVEWGKIIFWLDAQLHKIYCTTCIFIKINKKLKSITKSIHHAVWEFLPQSTVQVIMVKHLLGTDRLYLWIWTGEPKLNHKTWNVGNMWCNPHNENIEIILMWSTLKRLICHWLPIPKHKFYWAGWLKRSHYIKTTILPRHLAGTMVSSLCNPDDVMMCGVVVVCHYNRIYYRPVQAISFTITICW